MVRRFTTVVRSPAAARLESSVSDDDLATLPDAMARNRAVKKTKKSAWHFLDSASSPTRTVCPRGCAAYA